MLNMFEKISDQELVDKIRQTTKELAKLGEKADNRGITVWLKDSGYQKSLLIAKNIKFNEAHRVTHEKFS